MDEHSTKTPGVDEPEGGWARAPELSDTQVLSVVLCRYTADKIDSASGQCLARMLRLHPDQDCTTLYHQAEALQAGVVHYDLPAHEVTKPAAGSDPTYIAPL